MGDHGFDDGPRVLGRVSDDIDDAVTKACLGKASPDQPMHARYAVDHSFLAADTGDEVVTGGGLLGKVTDVGETFITLEIADGVRIKVQKTQITQLMPKGTLKSS